MTARVLLPSRPKLRATLLGQNGITRLAPFQVYSVLLQNPYWRVENAGMGVKKEAGLGPGLLDFHRPTLRLAHLGMEVD